MTNCPSLQNCKLRQCAELVCMSPKVCLYAQEPALFELNALLALTRQNGNSAAIDEKIRELFRAKQKHLAALMVIAQDFNEMLTKHGLHCECGESDCRTTRLRTALEEAKR